MAKVLIIADVHIDNYAKYNPTPNYRFNQFDRLAERINELAKSHGCTETWIAGDLINKPVPEPEVLHKTKQFIRVLKDATPTIRFIRGQHDVFGKSRIQSEENSNLNLFDDLIYMDHKILEKSGHKFAFMDWTRKQDLSWIKDKVDVMIGHVSIRYGQNWDRSKFDIGFFGDIHMEFQDGNCISITNPIQHRISDEPNGSVILLDTSSLKWERLSIKSSNWTPLTMVYTEEGLGYNSVTNCWEVKKKSKAKITTAKEVVEVSGMEFNSILEDQVAKSGLLEIHKEVTENCKDYHPINFDFKLKKIQIHNIKGISDFTYTFDDNLLIVGRNGSGKSSFILSIYQFLTGAMDWDRLQRRGHGHASVRGEILYEGKTYSLTRGVDENQLLINGVEVPYKDKREFNGMVEKHLPFIKYYQSYYFNYWVSELLREENNDLKMRIVSKFNGLDIFDNLIRYTRSAIDITKSDLKDAQKSVDKSKERIAYAKSRIDRIKLPEDFDPDLESLFKHKSEAISSIVSTAVTRKRLANYVSVFNDYDGEDLTGLIDSTSDELESIRTWKSEFDKLKEEGKSIQEVLNDAIDDFNRLRRNPNKCPKCNQLINPESYNKHLTELEDNVKSLQKKYDELRSKYKSYKDQESSKHDKYIQLKSKLADYQELLQQYLAYQELKKSVTELKLPEDVVIAYDPDSNDKDKVDESYRSYLDNLHNYHLRIELESDINSEQSKLDESRKLRDQLRDRLKNFESYLNLISKDGPVFLAILKDLMSKLSNEQFKFRVSTRKVRGSVINTISVRFWDPDAEEWRDYEDCSQGQKSLCDTYFMSKLLNGIGILVFDEYYSHVDDDYLPLIAEMLNGMQVNNILLSTHSNNFQGLDCDILTFPIN